MCNNRNRTPTFHSRRSLIDMPTALDYAKRLIEFDSVSSVSNVEVTDYVESVLKGLGGQTERLEYDDQNGVRKACVVGRFGPEVAASEKPVGMAYFGHTDVVPADNWFTDEHGPFTPTLLGGRLYGRGSCDMKGSVACMLAAAEQCDLRSLSQPFYITCTADEEIGYGGARRVAAESKLFAEMVKLRTRGIIGEPTRLEVVHAHKGTYGLKAISRGRAAHSSTAEGINANLAMIPFLSELKVIHDEVEADPRWHDDRFTPPTQTWNIIICDHTRAVNITPAQSICQVYFRPMPEQDADQLVERCQQKADECGIELQVMIRGQAVYIAPDSPLVLEALELAERERPTTVAYSTDGAMLGALDSMIVIGPGDIQQAHTHDEWIGLDQLELGTQLYLRMIRRWCGQ